MSISEKKKTPKNKLHKISVNSFRHEALIGLSHLETFNKPKKTQQIQVNHRLLFVMHSKIDESGDYMTQNIF